MLRILLLVSISVCLILAKMSSQLPLNQKGSRVEAQELQENVLNASVNEKPINHTTSAVSDSENELETSETFPGSLESGTSRSSRQDEARRQMLKDLKSMHDIEQLSATVTIQYPVAMINALELLKRNIEWGMFEEIYKNRSPYEKAALIKVRRDLGF